MSFVERLRALGWFLAGSAWFLFSDFIAYRAAGGLSSTELQEPLYRIFLVFLLVVGYWLLSRLGQRKMAVGKSTGLSFRPGWGREFGLGAALGWSGAIACVLPIALIGGLVVTVFTSGHQFWMAVLQLIALGAGTLAIEVAFRGYPFQRLMEAMGPGLAAFFMAVVYAIWRTHASGATGASLLESFLLGSVLAAAVLRTRALWVGWGFHFAWAGALGMLFGLPVTGSMSYSPVITSNTQGPAWITGNAQGPEGSAVAVLVSFLLLFAMARVTRELKYKYGFPELVPGGIAVDLDAAARRQHEAAMGAAERKPTLVQIQPAPPVSGPAATGENAMPTPEGAAGIPPAEEEAQPEAD